MCGEEIGSRRLNVKGNAMLEDRTIRLIHGWLDTSLDDGEFVELEATLSESPEARRRFWHEADFHSDLHEAFKSHLRAMPATTLPDHAKQAVSAGHRPSFGTRLGNILRRHGALAAGMVALVAGGCGLGSMATSLSLAYAGMLSPRNEPVTIVREGFEAPPHPRHDFVPLSPGHWSGDITKVVGPEQGVTPRSGEAMLRFVDTAPSGESAELASASEIWRLVDLADVREQLGHTEGRGDISLEFTAAFNGVAAAAGRTPKCVTRAIATDAVPPVAGSNWHRLLLAQARESDPVGLCVLAEQIETLDQLPASWQRLTVTLRAPASARWLILYCAVGDGSDVALRSPVRLEGQYVDDIRLRASPTTDGL